VATTQASIDKTVNLTFDAGENAKIYTVRIGQTNLTVHEARPTGYSAVYIGMSSAQPVYVRYKAWHENSGRVLKLEIKARGDALFKSLAGEYTVWAGSGV
jgi:hypothetical protein